MPDQEFKLLITGDASGAVQATQQAGDAARKLKVDTSDLSDETKRLLNINPPLDDAFKKTAKAAEGAGEGMGVNRREARELGNELGRLTGVGGLGRATIGGLGMAAFAAAASLEFLKGTWEDMQEAAKGHVDIQVKADDAAKITALASAYTTFAEALRKTREAQTSPEATAARDIKQLQEKLKLLQDILKAEEAEALANLATKKDQMSPQAYAAAESQIKAAFSGKEVATTQKEKQDEIDRKRQEAADLEKKSAEDKAKGEATAARAGVLSTAQKNEETAKGSIDAIGKDIELVKRFQKSLAGGDVPEYYGATGKEQQAQDWLKLQMMAGIDQSLNDLLKNLELQKAQAESQIALGEKAKAQEQAGKESTARAAQEKGQSEKILAEADYAQSDLNAEMTTTQGTQALDAVGRALGREHEAENNNTPTGARDAVAALNAGADAARQTQAAIKAAGDTNKELHDALTKALAGIAAENKKLAAKIQQMQFNGK